MIDSFGVFYQYGEDYYLHDVVFQSIDPYLRAINQIDDTGTVPISEALQVLAVPTWEPLPSDAQAALNALTAYKGRTTITVTAKGPEPDVAVEYVQDTRMVVADLQAQIDAIRNGGTT